MESNSSSSTSSSTTSSEEAKANGNCTPPENGQQRPFMVIKTYLTALRPWSLSASIVPTILGAAVAYRAPPSNGPQDFSVIIFVLNIFTIITVHCAGNVVNTYFDYVKGIDNRKSDDRTLVDHILTKDEVSII